MRPTRHGALFGALTIAIVVSTAGAAGAHGLGDGEGLPISATVLAWGAGFVVAASFVGFGLLWQRPDLDSAARGRPLPRSFDRAVDLAVIVGRFIAAAVYVITIAAAFTGSRFAVLNVAPWVVFVGVAVAMPVVSLLFGDVWRAVSPLRTMASLAALIGARFDLRRRHDIGDWPAVVALAAFVWLELAYHDPASPQVLAWALVSYSMWAVVPAVVLGTQWTDRADGLGWWFSAVSTMSPWASRRQSDPDSNDAPARGIRSPFVGAVRLDTRQETAMALLVVIGATTFDGVSRLSVWSDITGDRFGWDATLYASLGLLWTISAATAIYHLACRVADRRLPPGSASARRFAPTLIPIAFGYSLAHSFASLVFDGQTLLIRASDPFGDGSDWFGTAGWIENTRIIGSATIVWTQVVAVVAGHVVATMLAHDRATLLADDHRSAARSQVAMIGAMVLFTTAGLLLLVDA